MLLVYVESSYKFFFPPYDSGKTVSLDPKSNIMVPEDRDGLYAIDILDPDLVCVISYIFMLAAFSKKLGFSLLISFDLVELLAYTYAI